jgi:DNA excision repair protein ERCC-5
MNKQGNLNEFFDVTSGNGVYPPRKRQAYTSKRLQKVVSDFRAGQSKGRGRTGTPRVGRNEGPDSGSNTDGDSGKKKAKTRKRKRKKTEQAGISRTKSRKSSRRPGGDRDGHETESGDEYDDGDVAVTETLGVRLRPRPTPAYKEASEMNE